MPDAPANQESALWATRLICRCEEVPATEVVAAIQAGAWTLNDIKRRTRAGMGACQGLYCLRELTGELARYSGQAPAAIAPMTARPPARVLTVEALARLALLGESSDDDGENS